MSEGRDIGLLGPGVAVLVVGESGVGKDTLLEGAARCLGPDRGITFVQRVVTRHPHGSEAFVPMKEPDFQAAREAGAFALSWDAHGLSYGVLVATDGEIAAGRSIVINASRSIIAAARARYARLKVVVVACDAAVRAERLALRGRESPAAIAARMARKIDAFDPRQADAIVDNSGPPEDGIAQLAAALRAFTARYAM